MPSLDQQALLKAGIESKFDEIEALLNKGANPQFTLTGYPTDSTEMKNYETPLGAIVKNLYSPKHLVAVRSLLDAGAGVNTYTHHACNHTRSTPLGIALLAQGSMSNPKIQQEVVDLLLSRGADVNLLSGWELERFLNRGEPRIFESLLNAGLDPNTVAEGRTLLEHVIQACTGSWGDNPAEKAKLLINRGANLSIRDREGLTLAQRAVRPDIVHLLLEKNDSMLATMRLHDDVILESAALVQRLIDRGDNLNALNGKGNTPLMKAAEMGKAEAAFVLMEAGANMNIHNSNGETAMHLAMPEARSFGNGSCDYSYNPRFPILLELYSRGAIPQLDKDGLTPLMRCHIASKDYRAIYFCIDEFSKFEARYYCFDEAEYAQEMKEFYEKAIRTFERLPTHDRPEHRFIGKLTKRSLPSIMPTRKELVSQAIKHLLIALASNNATMAGTLIKRFPEIDLNQLTDKEGHRPFSIVIRSVSYSKDDCLPLLTILLTNHTDVNLPDNNDQKDTPLLACANTRYAVDIRSMQFLLANGANPNLGNAQNYTPLHQVVGTFLNGKHYVEEATELLLLNGSNPDALSNNGKKPIDMLNPYGDRNQIPSIFDKFQPQKNNLIDAALSYACSVKNRTLFIHALRQNLCMSIKDNAISCNANETAIPIETIIGYLQERQDLTPYARNCLAFFNTLDELNLPKKRFSEAELKTLYKLTYSLHQASLDFITAVSQISREWANEWSDIKEMHASARKIQSWSRKRARERVTPIDSACDTHNRQQTAQRNSYEFFPSSNHGGGPTYSPHQPSVTKYNTFSRQAW